MKINVYNIINNPLPKLNILKTINVDKDVFSDMDKIIKIFNKELQLDKLDSEHIYALSLTYGLIPRGIIQVAVGSNEESICNTRGLAIALLLTGGEQFVVFHNHPGGNKKISEADCECTEKYRELGDIIGIRFLHHIMVTKNHYEYCIRKQEYIPFD